ncbi:MAG: Fe-S cluster assembly ATPase SufC [Candidatus Andersenbacteria bacterium]
MSKNVLSIKNLHVARQDKEILKGISLEVGAGELHVLLGPNGSGKSTLAAVLAGDPRYKVTQGSVTLDGKDFLALSPEQRALSGVFIGFQHPVEVPGLSTAQFLRAALNAKRAAAKLAPLGAAEFLTQAKNALHEVGLVESTLERAVNVGFSGGEKKRLELAQLLLLQPRFAILDEIDSGIDVDGLNSIAASLERFYQKGGGLLVITHNPRLVEQLKVAKVHTVQSGHVAEQEPS